jgi:hypothetical protein
MLSGFLIFDTLAIISLGLLAVLFFLPFVIRDDQRRA